MKTYLSQPLPTVAPGQHVEIVAIAAGQRATRRLQDLGLVPGVNLRVVRSQGHGALILAVGEGRLAVERGIAHKVLVQPTMQPDVSKHLYCNDQEVSSCPQGS